MLAMLVAAERRTASPMIDISLFRNPRFTAASASVAIAFFALLGFIFLMTQYFQVVQAYSPLTTGVRLLPVAASVAVASVAGTRLAVRIGNKIIVGGGLACFCAALVWISTVSQGTSYGIISAQMVVLGTGMGLTQAPATESIMGAVPRQKAGIASAVNGATRLFGGTLGVAVIGSVAASLYTSRLTALLPAGLPPRAAAAAAGSVGGAQVAAQHLSQAGLTGAAHALSQAAQLAFLHSLTGACLVAAGMAGAGVLLVTFLLPARPQTQQAGIRAADNTTAHIARGPAGALAPGASTVVPGPATPPSPALPERPAP